MRIKLAVAAFALTMLSSTVANAASIGDLVLDQTNFVNYPGDTNYLTGNFTNISPTDTIVIDSLSLQTNPAEPVEADLLSSVYSGDILGPGQDLVSTYGGDNPYPPFAGDVLFGKIVSNTVNFTGIVDVFFDDLTTGASGIESNRVNIVTNVPEPGSLALLSGCLLSGGLFIKRRRK